MSKKKTKPDPRNVVPTIPLPPPKQQQASAPTATKRKQFRDEPGVQQTLFTLDEGGAK